MTAEQFLEFVEEELGSKLSAEEALEYLIYHHNFIVECYEDVKSKAHKLADLAEKTAAQRDRALDLLAEKDAHLQRLLPPADPNFEAFVAEQAKLQGITVLDGNKYPYEFIEQMYTLYYSVEAELN